MAAKHHKYAMHKGQYWVFETAKTPRTTKTKLHTVHGGHTVDFECPIPVLVVLSPCNKYLLQFLCVLALNLCPWHSVIPSCGTAENVIPRNSDTWRLFLESPTNLSGP